MTTVKNIMTKGQAMLTVIYVVIVGMIITTGAAYVLLSNTITASVYELGASAAAAAESGAENALLRLIRDPSYVGETMNVGSIGSVEIVVSGNGPFTITSTATVGTAVRRVTVTVEYVLGELTIISWEHAS